MTWAAGGPDTGWETAMGFFGLGKSPVKSADPRERERAVRDLPAAEQGTFIELALGDDDAAVRVAAAARVREPEFLEHLAKHKDPAIAKIGRDRLAAIAVDEVKKRKPADAVNMLQHINEQNALTTITLQADHADVRRAAFDRLIAQAEPSEAMLTRIAVQDESGDLASRALDKISKRQHLKEISKKAKAAAVKTKAEQLLSADTEQRAQPSREQRRRERARMLATLIDRARHAGDSDDWKGGEQIFASINADFDEVLRESGDLPEDDSVRESRTAIDRARGHFLRMREEALAAPAAPAPAAEDADVAAADAEAAAPGEDVPVEAIKEKPAVEHEPLEPALQTVADELNTAMAALLEADDLREAEQQVFALDKRWRVELAAVPNQHPTRERFMSIWQELKQLRRTQRENRHAEQDAQAEKLEPFVVEAEALAAKNPTDEELKAHRDALKDLQQRRKELGRIDGKRGRELHNRFRKACDKAYQPVKRLHEANEWERFARAGKAEELIAAAKALAEVEDLEAVLTQVKSLQADWKALGGLPRERNDELWGAFKEACDQVYERLAPIFEQRDAERAENLVKKRALLTEVQDINQQGSIGIAGSQADRDAQKTRFERVQAIHAEWQEIGPVPRGEDRDLWRAYRGARDTYFAARRESFKELDAERVENLNHKLALCVAADELAEDLERHIGGTAVGSKSEADFIREVKALQKQYRDIGHVPRDRFEEIRDRFKAACDKIYQGLEPWFAKQDGERQGNLEKKQALLNEMKELLEEERPDWFKDDAAKIRSQWREIGPIPRDQRQVEDEFYEACSKIFDAQPQ